MEPTSMVSFLSVISWSMAPALHSLRQSLHSQQPPQSTQRVASSGPAPHSIPARLHCSCLCAVQPEGQASSRGARARSFSESPSSCSRSVCRVFFPQAPRPADIFLSKQPPVVPPPPPRRRWRTREQAPPQSARESCLICHRIGGNRPPAGHLDSFRAVQEFTADLLTDGRDNHVACDIEFQPATGTGLLLPDSSGSPSSILTQRIPETFPPSVRIVMGFTSSSILTPSSSAARISLFAAGISDLLRL